MTSICQLLTNYNKTSTTPTTIPETTSKTPTPETATLAKTTPPKTTPPKTTPPKTTPPKTTPPKTTPPKIKSWADEQGESLKNVSQNKITLMSWSILKNLYNKTHINKKFEIRYKNQEAIVTKINDYIIKNGSDILFTQESIVSIPNYTSIYTTYKNSAIGIYLKKNVFDKTLIKEESIVRSYYKPETSKYEQESSPENVLDSITKYDLNNTRPIIAIRLKHMETDQYFIFVNVLFELEYETKAKDKAKPEAKATKVKIQTEDDYTLFKQQIELIIAGLYKDNDRIIIAGDFSGISQQLYKNSFNTININNKDINLFLKQKNKTCCGSNKKQLNYDPNKPQELKDKDITDLITSSDKLLFNNDLLYDSQNNSLVTVDTKQKTAYHHPIIGTINLGTIEAQKNSRQSKNGNPQASKPHSKQQSRKPQSRQSKTGNPQDEKSGQSGPRQSRKPSNKTAAKTANPTDTATQSKTIKTLQSKAGKSHAGGNIKYTNLTIKSKKLKKTKKLRKLKKLRN